MANRIGPLRAFLTPFADARLERESVLIRGASEARRCVSV
jgi:hypothetical protein